MHIKDLLIQDIKNLPPKDIVKLYKYVRRYLIADIEGLKDPLEELPNPPKENKE